jgi:putative FmdB family regulatory protein
MPIYEYVCGACGHEFDQLVKMSAPDPACVQCGGVVRKKVSAAGFILKGGGWYKDHYGLKKSGGSGESTGGSSPAPSAPASTGGSTGGTGSTGGGSSSPAGA